MKVHQPSYRQEENIINIKFKHQDVYEDFMYHKDYDRHYISNYDSREAPYVYSNLFIIQLDNFVKHGTMSTGSGGGRDSRPFLISNDSDIEFFYFIVKHRECISKLNFLGKTSGGIEQGVNVEIIKWLDTTGEPQDIFLMDISSADSYYPNSDRISVKIKDIDKEWFLVQEDQPSLYFLLKDVPRIYCQSLSSPTSNYVKVKITTNLNDPDVYHTLK